MKEIVLIIHSSYYKQLMIIFMHVAALSELIP